MLLVCFVCLSEASLFPPCRCRTYVHAVSSQLKSLWCVQVQILRRPEVTWGIQRYRFQLGLVCHKLCLHLKGKEHSKQVYNTKLCLFKTGFKYMWNCIFDDILSLPERKKNSSSNPHMVRVLPAWTCSLLKGHWGNWDAWMDVQLALLYVPFSTYWTFLLHTNSEDNMSQQRNVVP